jgi:hypothetical protein
MENNSLLLVGQLCNEGYYITFNIDGITIFNHEGKPILKGHMDLLWCINLRKGEPHIPVCAASNVYGLSNTGFLWIIYTRQCSAQPNQPSLKP